MAGNYFHDPRPFYGLGHTNLVPLDEFFNGQKETTTWMLQKQQHMHAAADEYHGNQASMGPRRASMPGPEYMLQREDTFREYRRPEMRDDTFTRYQQHHEMRQVNGRDPSYSQYDASQVKHQQQQGGGYRDDHNNFGGKYTSSASSKPPKAQSNQFGGKGGGQSKYADNDVSEDDDDQYPHGGSNGAKKSGSGKGGNNKAQNQYMGGAGGAGQSGGWMANEYDDERGVQGMSKKSLGKSMSNGNLQDMQFNGMNGGGQGMWRGGESTEGYGRSMSVPKMPPTSKSSNNKSQGQYNGGQGGQGMWMQNDFDDDDNRVNSSGKKSGAKGNKSSLQNGYNGQGGWMGNGDFDEDDDDNRMNGARASANKVSKGTGNGHNMMSASNGRGDDAWAYAQNSKGQGYNGNMQKPKSAMKQGNAQQRSSKYDTSDDEEDNDNPIKKGVKWALGLGSSSNNSRSHSHNGGGHDQYNQKGSKVSSNNRFENQGYANQGYDDMSRSGSKKSGGGSQGKSGQHYNGHLDDLSPMLMPGGKKSGLKKSKSVDFDEMGYSSPEENWGNFNVSSKGAQYNQSSSAKGGHQQQQGQGASGKAQNKLGRSQSLELKVPICCDNCERKVRASLLYMNGLEDILCDQWSKKVTVVGNVNPESVLKRVRRVKKDADLWQQSGKKF